jgi:hypothetical protein
LLSVAHKTFEKTTSNLDKIFLLPALNPTSKICLIQHQQHMLEAHFTKKEKKSI